ncbi:C40 family peptidase [Lentilactobacillus sp. SPB1-3]|uniref:NlpC/P60 family protein n=1 Tax=Lentilactobacillus terminaliae TaxID=3003483 RepID=A0ACD5DHB3_9LACO|nr:C40 family peptidase [Lentilactobacillus sp. SPB1-3]MCZ0977031.1 C40 family peptidase [Lentilactobacillus sp. SPB1-3]
MKTMRINVPVATIWTSKDSIRPVDKLAVAGNTKQWTDQMTDQETIDLGDNDRVVTQALFNDEVIIDRKENDWLKVVIPSQTDDSDKRGYPGWVPSALVSEVESSPVTSQVRIATKFADLYDENKQKVMELSQGTVFEETSRDDEWIGVNTPKGAGFIKASATMIPVDADNSGQIMVELAQQFMGLRYIWSGISSYGFDCSGLVYSLHRVLGILIPRDADDQHANGNPISPENALPGDLVFFAYDHGKGYVHHVGMYIGNGKMIESRTLGKTVDIAELTEPKFAEEFAGFRRYWH